MKKEIHLQPISLAAVMILCMMAYVLWTDREDTAVSAAAYLPLVIFSPANPPAENVKPVQALPDPAEIRPPYDNYIVTQGPHGQSYGHLAIDLTAGKGAKILSPIDGIISELFIDEYGNPTLIVENEVWRVTLLHGDYSVSTGEHVQIGQVIGRENNHGYTLDYRGRSCRGRDCGYHTHLNIFDHRIGSNVNPLDLFGD